MSSRKWLTRWAIRGILLASVGTGCGYDPDCFDGCDRPEVIQGPVGPAGEPGQSIQGPKGDRGERGLPGQSIQGPAGRDGQDAIPCAVSHLDGGASVSCPNGTAVIYDGIDGRDAEPLTIPPGTIVDVINPCGDEGLDEVILVTADGALIAHYSDGQRQHLTVLVPGRYTTTDGHACNFGVDDENNLTWED